MVWGSISYYGAIFSERTSGNMNSQGYSTVLQNGMLPYLGDELGETWALIHDIASVHRFGYTKNWLQEHEVDDMDWPVKFSDLNALAIVWGMMVCSICKHGFQLEDAQQLTEVIVVAWENIDHEYHN